MSVIKQVNAVTQRIAHRSEHSRAAYLTKISAAKQNQPARSGMGCGNLAHTMASCNAAEKNLLATERTPNIGIVTSYNDMLSAHKPYENYPQLIRNIAQNHQATAQVATCVPAMCDGITQGMAGMELSLFSRDVVAMSTAIGLSHNVFDGIVCLGICDKIVPGLLIGALGFGHLPTLFLPAGPMSSGIGNKQKARARQKYVEGKLDRKGLLAVETASYHSAGTCTFFGTANSNQMLVEIMGLQLPSSSFVAPDSELRQQLTVEAVEILISQLQQLKQPQPLSEVISVKTIVNGMVGLLATGGSTNHAIHLIAIARAAGIIIDWEDMANLSAVVPLLCRIYPNGEADINQFHAAGGMGFLILQLLQGGFLHNNVKTILGNGLERFTSEAKLINNPTADILHSGSHSELTSHKIKWQAVANKSLDETVLRTNSNPFSHQGGLKLLQGNLGRSVIKISAVKKEHRKVVAKALLFSTQEEFIQQFQAGELYRDFIAVLRFQGPKANGMPELHKLTPLMGALQDKGFQVAIVTDGRMSGASGKVPAAIHLVPEAKDGGLIGKINQGDLIRLDAENGVLELDIDEEELSLRSFALQPDGNSNFGSGRELFSSFRHRVNSAEEGASVFNY